MSVTRSDWLVVVTGKPTPLLSAVLTAAQRDASPPQVRVWDGSGWDWLTEAVGRLARTELRLVLAFDARTLLGACLANKMPAVRAAAVVTLDDARRALHDMGANFLLTDQRGKTWFELRQLLRICAAASPRCPDDVAKMLGELERHADR
jgi:hypothetical protein